MLLQEKASKKLHFKKAKIIPKLILKGKNNPECYKTNEKVVERENMLENKLLILYQRVMLHQYEH